MKPNLKLLLAGFGSHTGWWRQTSGTILASFVRGISFDNSAARRPKLWLTLGVYYASDSS
jgi:hypothetical protein